MFRKPGVQAKWKEVEPDAPVQLIGRRRAEHSVTLVGSEIFVFGGISVTKYVQTIAIYAFNVVLKRWRRIPLPGVVAGFSKFSLASHTATLVRDCIIFIGGIIGIVGNVRSKFVFRYDLVLSKFTEVETYGTPKQLRVVYHSADALPESDDIIVFSGDMGGGPSNNHPLHIFNAVTMTWIKQTWTGKVPVTRSLHATCMVGHRLYIFGGFTRRLEVLNDMHILDCSTRVPMFTELRLDWAPSGRYGTVLVQIQNMLFLFGGKSSATQHTIEFNTDELLGFNLADQSWTEIPSWRVGKRPSRRSNHKAVALKDKMLVFGGTNVRLTKMLQITVRA